MSLLFLTFWRLLPWVTRPGLIPWHACFVGCKWWISQLYVWVPHLPNCWQDFQQCCLSGIGYISINYRSSLSGTSVQPLFTKHSNNVPYGSQNQGIFGSSLVLHPFCVFWLLDRTSWYQTCWLTTLCAYSPDLRLLGRIRHDVYNVNIPD